MATRALARCGRRARDAFSSSASSRGSSRASRATCRRFETSLEDDRRRGVFAPTVTRRGRRAVTTRANASSRTSSSASSSASSSYESLASTLGEDRRELLEQFAHILIAANKGEYGTLTGATTAREALDDHVSDALALLPTFDALLETGTRVGEASASAPASGRRVCDVGSET